MPLLLPLSYVGDAVDHLATQQVYVDPAVPGAAALQATLENEVAGTQIAVVVLPDVANVEGSTLELLGKIGQPAGYDTLVLAVGDDFAGASRALAADETLKIANESENPKLPLDQTFPAAVERVVQAMPSDVEGGGGFGGGLIAGVLAGAVVLVIAVSVPLVLRRRRRAAREKVKPTALPGPIVADIATLRGFIPAYATAPGPVAERAARGIDVLATNTGELFMRLARRPDDGQISTAGIEYDAKLRKLIAALHPDYLLDIVRNPHLWDDPAERIAEVERALTAVSAEVVENIKQVNAFRALQFQVTLDGLVGGRKELQDWDRDFRAASGEG